MWKSEERKTEMTAPITLAPLDEQTLAELRHRYDDTSLRSCCEARTRRCVSSNASLQEAWTPFPGEPHQAECEQSRPPGKRS